MKEESMEIKKDLFRPLSNYILIRIHERKLKSGIVLPDTAKKGKEELNMLDFEVVAVSEERTENGERMVKDVKVGDYVICETHGLFRIPIAGKDYFAMRETNVIGIIAPPIPEEEPLSTLVN